MQVSNYPNGTTPFEKHTLLGDLPWPMPLYITSFFDDFHLLDDAEMWVLNPANDIRIVGGNGGIIRLTTTAVASQTVFMWLTNLDDVDVFGVNDRQNWFQISLRPDEIANLTWAAGLQTHNTSNAPTDTSSVVNGIWFRHAAGTSVIEIIIKSPSGTTTVELIDDYDPTEFVELTWRIDRNNILKAAVDGRGLPIPTSNLPVVPIQLTMGALTTENAVHFLDIDYVLVASRR